MQYFSLRTVANPAERRVGEDVVLVPVSEIARLREVSSRQPVRKGRVVDRLDVHIVVNLTCIKMKYG